MKDQEKNHEVTLSEALPDHLVTACAEFDAAWQDVRRGGPKPQIETYVADLTEPDRVTLSRELEKIEQKYEEWLSNPSQEVDPTVNLDTATEVVAPSSAEQAGTMNYESAPARASGEVPQTIE